jgi:hypothetical protein
MWFECIVSDYEHCLHTENTGQKRLVRDEFEDCLKLVWNFECYLQQPTLHNGRFVV